MTTINFKVSKLSSLKHLLPLHPPEPSCQSHLSKGQKENQIENILRISCEYKSCNGRRCKRSHSTSKEEYWRNVCCDIHSLSRPREQCPKLPRNEEPNHSSAQVKSSIVKPSYQNEKKGSTRNTENRYDDHGRWPEYASKNRACNSAAHEPYIVKLVCYSRHAWVQLQGATHGPSGGHRLEGL